MLRVLSVENIAVIEKAEIEFVDGFNALTGETGAGKSILIDSINAVLGGRTSRELIRNGASGGRVSAVFDGLSTEVAAKLSNLGFFCEDDLMILSRELFADGRSTCRINGRVCVASIMREIASLLINIHGQHDNQQILNNENHYMFLDRFAGNKKEFDTYLQAHKAFVETRKQLNALNMDENEKEYKIELLKHQINELEAANIKLNEKQSLTERKQFLLNSERVVASLKSAYNALSGDENGPGADSLLSRAENELLNASGYLLEIKPLYERLSALKYDLDDITEALRSYDSAAESDRDELNFVEERLDLFFKLGRKYGATEADMLDSLNHAKKELENIAFSEERIKELEAELEKAKIHLIETAKKLTESRLAAAKKLEAAISEELEFLDMPFVKFKIRMEISKYSSTGADSVEFLISTNPGEPPKPISKIASGGELSRIMLAIKNVLAEKDYVDTMIFDEIDTGISGRAASKVGLKLKETAKNHQIICVTHLAQIAAKADAHFLIEKSFENGRTYTRVKPLDPELRKKEIARIIGGEISEYSLKTAEEMLNT